MPKKKTTAEIIEEDTKEIVPPVDPDVALLSGTPEHGAPLEPEEGEGIKAVVEPEPSELEKVVIEGVEYMVAPDVATAYRAERATSQPAPILPAVGEDEREEEGELDTTAFFSDPEGFLKKRDEKLREGIIDELKSAYQQDKHRSDFWNTFYGANEDLKADKEIVTMVLSRNWESLQGMAGDEAVSELAKATRAEILKITARHGKGNAKGNSTTTLEGASSVTPTPVVKSEEDKLPVSISAAIRERAKQRRQNANLTT